MALYETLKKDLEDAMRAQDTLRLSVLRMVRASLHNKEIEKRARGGEPGLSEEETIAILRSEVKKRRDAIIEFKKGKREDLAEKESAELRILETYLPQELSDEEVLNTVRKVVNELGSVTIKDFGRVMASVMKKLGVQASGDRVSQIVRNTLQ